MTCEGSGRAAVQLTQIAGALVGSCSSCSSTVECTSAGHAVVHDPPAEPRLFGGGGRSMCKPCTGSGRLWNPYREQYERCRACEGKGTR